MKLTVTGTLSPDATGLYVETGTYNGSPAYKNGSYWIWYDIAGGTYYLSTTKGDLSGPSWGGPSPGPTGIYPAIAGATGTATAVEAPHSDIVSTAGSNGSISPSGTTTVYTGDSQAYTITANSGYKLQLLVVDGVSVTPAATYTFTNVTANHTIDAIFIALPTGSMTWALEERIEDAFVKYFGTFASITSIMDVYAAFGAEKLTYPCAVVMASRTDAVNDDALIDVHRAVQVEVAVITEALSGRTANKNARAAVMDTLMIDDLVAQLEAQSIAGLVFSQAQVTVVRRDVEDHKLMSVITVECIAQPKQ